MGDGACWDNPLDYINSEVDVLFDDDLYNQERIYILCPQTYIMGTLDRNAALPVAAGGSFPFVVINPNVVLRCEVPGTCILTGGSPQVTNLQDNTIVITYLALLGRQLPEGKMVDSSNLLVEGVTFADGTTDRGYSSVYLGGPGTNRTFTDCTWINNSCFSAISAGGPGSIEHLEFETTLVKDSIIENNSFEHSIIDGFNCWGAIPDDIISSITFDNTTIRDNYVDKVDPKGFPSLFPMLYTRVIFNNSEISGNTAEEASASFVLINSELEFENSVFTNNTINVDLYETCDDAIRMVMINATEPESCWNTVNPNVIFATVSCQEIESSVPAPVTLTICFSGENVVDIEGTGPTLMKDVKTGDKVMVQEGRYETIYSFGHRNTAIPAEYLQISTKEGDTIELSENHMIFSQGKAVAANTIQVGDVIDKDGPPVVVTLIQTVTRNGVYAPFTTSGVIFVNGFRASCYVDMMASASNKGEFDFFGIEKYLSMQALAHLYDTPRRVVNLLSRTCDNPNQEGIPSYIALGHAGTSWLLQQNNSAFVWIVMVPVLAVLSLFGVVEGVLTGSFAPLPLAIFMILTALFYPLVRRREKVCQ